MAKWGEGDPRWIVEERPDATNVNNWHWTEKNADAWSKAKIKVAEIVHVNFPNVVFYLLCLSMFYESPKLNLHIRCMWYLFS